MIHSQRNIIINCSIMLHSTFLIKIYFFCCFFTHEFIYLFHMKQLKSFYNVASESILETRIFCKIILVPNRYMCIYKNCCFLAHFPLNSTFSSYSFFIVKGTLFMNIRIIFFETRYFITFKSEIMFFSVNICLKLLYVVIIFFWTSGGLEKFLINELNVK